MIYTINQSLNDGTFEVPNDIVDDCIREASGKSIKILLYILRHKTVSDETMADNLGPSIDAEDIEYAVNYWSKRGVICSSSDPIFSVNSSNQNNTSDIQILADEFEKILSRPMTASEQKTFMWIHERCNLDYTIIILLIEFAVSADRYNPKYIEQLAESWYNKKINTYRQAVEEIKSMKSKIALQSQILSAMQLNRRLTVKEQEYINGWIAAKMSFSMIMLAYDKTIDAIQKVSFSYMNGIISNWIKNNIFTTEAVEWMERPHKPENNKSANNEHSYNLDLLIKHAMENVPKLKTDK